MEIPRAVFWETTSDDGVRDVFPIWGGPHDGEVVGIDAPHRIALAVPGRLRSPLTLSKFDEAMRAQFDPRAQVAIYSRGPHPVDLPGPHFSRCTSLPPLERIVYRFESLAVVQGEVG